jgi:hypothetical protein
MTLLDKVNSETRKIFNMVFDKEPVNSLEAASLYGVITQGRFNMTMLEILHNQSEDSRLKQLIKEALYDQTKAVIEHSEELLKESGGKMPETTFHRRPLHSSSLEIHRDAKLTDAEIAIAVGTMAKAAQMAILAALHQSYQLEVALMYRDLLDAGLDWDYRLLQLMLERGWLPHLDKITH